MRSMLQIAIAIQDGQDVTLEEAKLACLAYSHMLQIVEAELDGLAKQTMTEQKFLMRTKAGNAIRNQLVRLDSRKLPVDKYLGPQWTPGTPENEEIRKASDAILTKFAGDPKTNPVSAEVAREILKDRKGTDA